MKTIVITGASSGIGLATAEYLSQKGYHVYGLSRTKGMSNAVRYLSCDITKKEEVIRAFAQVEGEIVAVINNAGMGISGPVEFASLEAVKRIIDVNLLGTVNVCQVAIPYLRKSKGRIINIGSVAGEMTIPFQAFYSVTKAGVEMLSEALNIELKPFGIKVITVLPGDTKTSFTKNRQKEETDDLYRERLNRSVSKMEQDEERGMSPLRVAKVIAKVIKKKRPPLRVTVGLSYKILVFLKRFVPLRFVNFIIDKMYGGN
jgi:short-subunit dehydrogenase